MTLNNTDSKNNCICISTSPKGCLVSAVPSKGTGSVEAILEAMTNTGTKVRGSDTINVVQ
jgi:hypothetical protein